MPSSPHGLSGVNPDISSSGCKDDLWEPGQEWIIIFDNLLKHPQGIKKGCPCDICSQARSPIMPACPLSTRLSLPTNIYKTGRRRSVGIEKADQICAGVFEMAVKQDFPLADSSNPRTRGGSVDRILGKAESRKQSGTVDEVSFIHQFLVPGSVLVLSRKDLDLQLASVYTSLSSTDWRRRMEGLQLMRGLVTGGAGQMEEFPGRLKYLEQPFESCVKDLRSHVIRECCVTVSYLAHELQYKIETFLLHLLPFLLHLIQHGAKVVSSSGIVCIRFILQNTYCTRFLPIICKAVASKSRTTRCNIFQFLEQILHVWPIHTLEGQTEDIQDALMSGLGDGDQDTRCWARKAYWAFADHFRVEADSLLSYLDQSRKQPVEGDTSDGSVSFPRMSGSRSRQSSVDRSQDSLDWTRACSSESQFDRGSRRSSSRVNRGYGSLDHGRASPLVPPLQRSNSAVDATAARRALVRQQYSQNSRNKVQRTGSLRRGSEQSSGQEIPRRQSAGKRTQSQPVSRSASPAAKSLYQTHRQNSDADMRKAYLQTKATPNIATKEEKYKPNIQQKTMSSDRKEAKLKIENSFISSQQGQIDQKDISIANNEKGSVTRKSSAVEEWVEDQNKYWDQVPVGPVDCLDEEGQVMTEASQTKEEDQQISSTGLVINKTEQNSGALLDILENVLMDDDSNQLLEILETVEELLENNTAYWSSLQLTNLLFNKLFMLIKCDRKEVSRAAESTTNILVLCMPSHLAIPHMDNLIKKEQFPDMMIAIQLLDKVLEGQKAETVKPHLKEIVLGLLKAYGNVESSVRKVAVNCMVTLNALVGDSALQPHLYCLSGPKRKLLSLYIMRHRQKMVASQR